MDTITIQAGGHDWSLINHFIFPTSDRPDWLDWREISNPGGNLRGRARSGHPPGPARHQLRHAVRGGRVCPQDRWVTQHSLSDIWVNRYFLGRTGRVGNLGKATSLFCPDFDGKMSAGLVKVLAAAQRDIPDFVASAAEENPAEEDGGGKDDDAGFDDDDW